MFRNLDETAREKGKLIQHLPPHGLAVLNADDPRVDAMADLCRGRVLRFGTTTSADVRAEEIRASWPDRLSFTLVEATQRQRIATQLCGVPWHVSVLAALATAQACGASLDGAAAAAAAGQEHSGRMEPVTLGKVTHIRNDFKSSPESVEQAFVFLEQARAKRKIAVIGHLSDTRSKARKVYRRTAERARRAADLVVMVSRWGHYGLAAETGDDSIHAFDTVRDAHSFLRANAEAGDLVLIVGRGHLERLSVARQAEHLCWLSDCGRTNSCLNCKLRLVAAEPG
ncbi:MAG: Mur ligase family protein [Acidobacteriota bacterium]|nr:Mur ligase family protein [Acidobacteriota bacterium]